MLVVGFKTAGKA